MNLLKTEYKRPVRLRFDDKNKILIENFIKVKEQLNSRGLLHSTETIKAMYKILELEFNDCITVITDSVMDITRKNNLLIKHRNVLELCEEELSSRKKEIEDIYLSNTQQIRNGLLNPNMLTPFISLDDIYPLQKEEMVIKLTHEIDKYFKENGNNLRNIIQNRFLNIPIIAWVAIVIVVIVALASFTNALSNLSKLFNN